MRSDLAGARRLVTARYVRVPRLWNAIVDVERPEPAAWLAGLTASSFRYRLPARRRFGAARAAVVRLGVPEPLVAAGMRRLRRVDRPDLDALVASVPREWLPAGEAAGVVELNRAAARTVFVFAGEAAPAVVLKFPAPGHEGAEREAAALVEVEEAAIAPRPLGRLGGAYAQTGVRGRALRVEPVTPSTAATQEWTAADRGVGEALARLAAATGGPGEPARLVALVEAAAHYADLADGARKQVQAAAREVVRVARVVRRHGDTSPQNCIVDAGRLQALVDWENTLAFGAPGFDVWNAALSKLENGVGLAKWTPEIVQDVFRAAWGASPLMEGSRRAARAAMDAAGVEATAHDAFEVAFFARRLALRLERPDRYIVDVPTAASMLRTVCAS